MGFFSIFKKKEEQIIVPTDSIEGIVDGILFDDGVFLKWGSNIESDKLYIKKEYRADRIIYHWGEGSILDGLTLYLKTICWNHKQHGDARVFESIDFISEDNDAEDKFYSIKAYIIDYFGEPRLQQDVKQGDIALEWRIKAIKISLNLFYKDRRKVHLEIGWWV